MMDYTVHMKFLQHIFASRFFVIYLLTFVNGLSMTMLFPVLPFIVKSYGEPEVVLWILLWTFSLFQFLAAPILGSMSDSFGRKPVLILTQWGTFLSWVVLWCAYLVPDKEVFGFILLPILIIFLSRIFDGITGWNASVAQAVLADMSSPEDRSKVFGMNGAVFWVSLLVWPALGSLSVSMWYSFFGTALLWAIISAITLLIMIFLLHESLPQEKRKAKMKIRLREINVFAQVIKWSLVPTIRYALIMKLFMFTAFVFYTSVSALYLMDVYGFSATNIGYYLTFTGSFLIFHQSLSIRYFVSRFWDAVSLRIALCIMSFGFIWMGLSPNIFIFTILYFFWVLWISLSFSTLGALFSRCVDEKHQWEVMGMSTGVESLISIGAPVLATLLYWYLNFSIFILVWCIPLFAFLLSIIFFSDIEFRKKI